jgi:hypothetical protein
LFSFFGSKPTALGKRIKETPTEPQPKKSKQEDESSSQTQQKE